MDNLFKALADENRLRILNLLFHYELCVCEFEVILDLTQSNVSRHLGKLKSNNIITGYKDAQWIHYRISNEFKGENKMLMEYLINKFSSEEIFTADLEKCRAYVESPYTCQTINNEKELVLSLFNNL
ncbi:ArsR/SmtB family transcription factor [Gudongella sp. DL1XJH-153]|uniref:ArsR/SmtB family transcription factor n=1 Tax=Gudongella sp. DL1XJH-153 TaxID=3409804 RepID=UPI003BB550EC